MLMLQKGYKGDVRANETECLLFEDKRLNKQEVLCHYN